TKPAGACVQNQAVARRWDCIAHYRRQLVQCFLLRDENLPESHPNPDRVLYLLQILDVRSFNPSDAFNPHRARVATAKITLQNAKPDEAYDVYISFDSEVTPGQFRLSLDGDPSQYGFSYTLFFQDEPVNPDEQESWLGLTLQGPNEAYIDARIIEESKAENAPAGTYSDTIRVSITPFDTI
ncbi:MAG: hypothetical protein PHS76_09755, partial [Sphaerochaeta sp.]|nr:hypothetical protein [Sphaerochaeta sp.]